MCPKFCLFIYQKSISQLTQVCPLCQWTVLLDGRHLSMLSSSNSGLKKGSEGQRETCAASVCSQLAKSYPPFNTHLESLILQRLPCAYPHWPLFLTTDSITMSVYTVHTGAWTPLASTRQGLCHCPLYDCSAPERLTAFIHHSTLTASTESSCPSHKSKSASHKWRHEQPYLNTSKRQTAFGKFPTAPSSDPVPGGDVLSLATFPLPPVYPALPTHPLPTLTSSSSKGFRGQHQSKLCTETTHTPAYSRKDPFVFFPMGLHKLWATAFLFF